MGLGGANALRPADWSAIPELKWMKANDTERYLGSYLGTTEAVSSHWESLVAKIQERANKWARHHVSILARIIVSKSSLASCMWYMSQCMATPPGINKRIQQIIDNYVWGKQPRFMAFPEGCKPKKENGMGLMSVAAQAAAFNIKAIIQLIAPGVEKWKVLPNYWLNQAGAKWGLETKILTAKLTPKLKKSINKIKFPLFWKQALNDWFKNPPVLDPAELEATEILNQNLWHNPLITIEDHPLDLPTLFNKKNANGQIINGYFIVQDLWDESENDWTDIGWAESQGWVTTVQQKRDYYKIIDAIETSRPEWVQKLKDPEPPPELGSFYASVDHAHDIDEIFKVSSLIDATTVSCFQTNLKPDRSLDTLEEQTTVQTADIIKCNVVSVKGKIKLQGLTHETNILFDKTSWGENEKQFNIQNYKVRMMRTLISTKKAKEVNSLEHWEALLRRTSINWGALWKNLSHNWVDKKDASCCLKMIHLIKRTKYAIRPHKCPSDCCPHVDNTDYIHACFTCPNVKKVWAHVMKLWVRMGNNEYTQKTFHNFTLGLPIIKHDDSPTPPAPISWTVVNSTVTRCLWVAWCNHVHEGETYNAPYLIHLVTAKIKSRLKELWQRSIRHDALNSIGKNEGVTKAKEKFKLHWCKPNGGVSINAHDKIIINLDSANSAQPAEAPQPRPTGSNFFRGANLSTF